MQRYQACFWLWRNSDLKHYLVPQSAHKKSLKGKMISEPNKQLAHILWIGGATDSGKSTVAQNLAQRYGIFVYHYDKVDNEQIEKLSKTVSEIHQFFNASMDDRWINTTPKMMLDFLLISFLHRFQLVIESLLEMPKEKPIIVEGFGLLPDLVHPMLSNRHQAIWFVPTEKFKRESMTRRGKPSFASSLTNPEQAKMNLFTRDMMLANYYRKQVLSYGYTLCEIDGSQSSDEMTDMAEFHFAKYLSVFSHR
jgi:2-phosphoglycerate kinase